MKKRSSNFRSVVVELECGCEHSIATSFYRLSQDRVSIIFGNAIRSGCWCLKHKTLCQPIKLLRTSKL